MLGQTVDKYAASYLAGELPASGVYYFVVRSFTPAHGDQQNDLWSDYSEEASANTQGPTSTPMPTATVTPTRPTPTVTPTGTRTPTSDFSCDRVTEIPHEECKALVALYQSTDGAHWRE